MQCATGAVIALERPPRVKQLASRRDTITEALVSICNRATNWDYRDILIKECSMTRIKTMGLVLAILCWLIPLAAVQAQELEKLPYVPTPQIVVDEMLKMAGVSA